MIRMIAVIAVAAGLIAPAAAGEGPANRERPRRNPPALQEEQDARPGSGDAPARGNAVLDPARAQREAARMRHRKPFGRPDAEPSSINDGPAAARGLSARERAGRHRRMRAGRGMPPLE